MDGLDAQSRMRVRRTDLVIEHSAHVLHHAVGARLLCDAQTRQSVLLLVFELFPGMDAVIAEQWLQQFLTHPPPEGTALLYLIRNTIDGKGYVGVTIKSAKQRFRKHCQSSNLSLIHI